MSWFGGWTSFRQWPDIIPTAGAGCWIGVTLALVQRRRLSTNAEPTAKLSSFPNRRRVLNRFGVGSVSSIVDRRWTGVAFTALCLVGHVLSTVIPYHIARKRETLAWCWFSAGPAFMARHWSGIVTVSSRSLSTSFFCFVFLWTWLCQ